MADPKQTDKPDVRDALDKELDELAAKVPAEREAVEVNASGGSLLQIVGGFLVVGLMAVGGVFAYQAMHAQPPPQVAAGIGAKLDLAAGEVVLASGDEAGKRLLSGTPLPIGATLETKAGARALIRLADGSRIFMRDDTSVELGEDTGIKVLRGEVWLESPPLDRNREPLVHRVGEAELVLTDGGASVAKTDAGARIYVAEGVAAVTTAGGRKEVRSGEQALVDGAGEPSVEAVAFWDDWTGGMADRRAGGAIGSGSGSLFAVDKFGPAGSKALPLQISRQTVDVAIEGNLAETRVDQRFFNPSERDVEGWYWFTVPDDAMLIGFAVETDGQLVEGEVVERQQAVIGYERAAASDDNPALLEWIDDRTVRARIYPVPAAGERRIVVRYQQLLSESDGKLRYTYPLAAAGGRDANAIEEFALAVELRDELASQYAIATSSEAKVDERNRLVTMRRSGFVPRADFELELTRKAETEKADALRYNEFEASGEQARFVMLRWLPDLDDRIDWGAIEVPPADVVVVVDTSAFGDASEHQSRIAVAEALLRSLAASDRFALVSADLDTQVLFPDAGMSEATPDNIAAALERLNNHRPGGATDLGQIFERALQRVHSAEQPAIVYVGDGLATSGERSADALAERLRRTLTGSRARLFTVGVGDQVDERLLGRLAQVGGGQSLRVEAPEQAVVRALELSGAIKTPTITDLELVLGEQGAELFLDERFDNATGKLARGEELVVLARTHLQLPEQVTIKGRLGGQDLEWNYVLERDKGVLDRVVPKLWAAAQVERLLGDGRGPDAVRGKILSLGLEYGLMTPHTSFLALDSESAYARQGIERRRRPWDFKLLAQVLPSEQPFVERRGVIEVEPSAGELLVGALTAPLGCAADKREEAPAATGSMRGGEAKREDARVSADMPEAVNQGAQSDVKTISELMAEEEAPMEPAAAAPPPAPRAEPAPSDGAAPGGGAFAVGGDDADVWGGLTGSEVGEAYGVGGMGLKGTGRGGGGTGEGTIDLSDSSAVTATKRKEKKDDFEDFLAADTPKSPEREWDESPPQAAKPTPDPGWADDKPSDWTASIATQQGRWRPSITSPVQRNQKLPCSDASARSLAQRKLLWEQRLTRSRDMNARLSAYEAAAGSCELDTWREDQVFLQLLQASAATEAEIEVLIAHLWDRSDARNFVVRALLRRLVDRNLIAAVERTMFGPVDWTIVDHQIALAVTDDDKLAALQAALDQVPDAPEGELRMIDLLFQLGRIDDAIARGRRLRDRGQMTPVLAERLGELLVRAGQRDEAKRVFSEIVEFDPGGEASRRMLGDIFLRHGWYQEAYHQFDDLLAATSEPGDAIRMARAAAGAGRVDEGLRLLRKVATGEGRPGADDPRRWARLHAAILLAQMLGSDDTVPADKLTRELKRLQLFDAPTTWTFVIWEDLASSLVLGPKPLPIDATPEQKQQAVRDAQRVSDAITAADTGLWAIERGGLEDLEARHSGEVPPRDVAFERVVVIWDGNAFDVQRTSGTIVAKHAWQGAEAKDAPAGTDASAQD
jgi:tetratricopeptide (TPR) repeat protein